ncbi:hypothetical protein DMN91_007686 [Ooceraea biroi]|uniref:Evolutionarily conserved signaling intermediate in Toll pathway, mitochondrial n=1 Tax=Ooceraea biroi TaxID=2015173 RepID=A0A026X5L2_OOCBI|nr:evolutionarily conserved signaling intermediate in Toll pathway, mitochondrial [Ooceraea biroi]EZA62739.1 Evolutionarily conserved signaling intermediate in Toll pathway, mitochondrial [Ooceraea biroi]RLU21070.1 hypothetical protein DMN91_007686 [Ooceraea biroi]
MLSRITRGTLSSAVSALLKQHKVEGRTLAPVAASGLHTKKQKDNKDGDSDKASALVLHSFANVERREKETYLDILRQYKANNKLRTGHVEFMKVALKYMDEFGVNRDLAVYKAVLDVLPKGRFIPTSFYQTITLHYPLQQRITTELLCKMEQNCVIPDYEMQMMLLNTFGAHARPLKKFWRMMYWMPKFANLNPWPCARPAPKDPQVLARLAIYKISSVDPKTKITEFEIKKDKEEAIESTWIVSAMSRLQEELLARHPVDSPIFVEGPYLEWVADQCIDYFVLRAEPTTQKKRVYEDIDDVSDIRIPFWDYKELITPLTVHEQSDGTYFAVCATGTSTKDSLLSWIRCLQKRNPVLISIPVVFKLSSSTKDKMFIDSSKGENEVAQTKD